jgi:hypothetical protein
MTPPVAPESLTGWRSRFHMTGEIAPGLFFGHIQEGPTGRIFYPSIVMRQDGNWTIPAQCRPKHGQYDRGMTGVSMRRFKDDKYERVEATFADAADAEAFMVRNAPEFLK